MSEMLNIKVPVIQFDFVNRNRMLYSQDAFVTYNDIKYFLEKRNVSKYVIEISVGSVKIIIRRFFFNIKKLQNEVDQVRPLGIRVECHKYTFKEWLMNSYIMKKLTSIYDRD